MKSDRAREKNAPVPWEDPASLYLNKVILVPIRTLHKMSSVEKGPL